MVFTENSERKLKQAYQRVEIIEGGYNADLFADYLETKKTGGSNIDNWRFYEQETLVELFKRQDPFVQPGKVQKHVLQRIELEVFGLD